MAALHFSDKTARLRWADKEVVKVLYSGEVIWSKDNEKYINLQRKRVFIFGTEATENKLYSNTSWGID